MTTLYLALATALMIIMLVGGVRIVRGPSPPDRMLAAQLSGTTTVSVLMLLAVATDNLVLLDVALVFALLAVMAAVAFTRLAWPAHDEERS